MNVQRLARVCVPAFLIVAHCAAQDIVELKPAAIVKVAGQKADGIVEPVKCDSRSNIYEIIHLTQIAVRAKISSWSDACDLKMV